MTFDDDVTSGALKTFHGRKSKQTPAPHNGFLLNFCFVNKGRRNLVAFFGATTTNSFTRAAVFFDAKQGNAVLQLNVLRAFLIPGNSVSSQHILPSHYTTQAGTALQEGEEKKAETRPHFSFPRTTAEPLL